MKRLSAFLVLIFAVAAIAQTGPPQQNRIPASDPWAFGPQNNTWNPSWNSRPNPSRGACIYTAVNFQGNHFCVRAGDSLPNLPGRFGNNISSIQVFGRPHVQIFDNLNFRGGNTMISSNVPDLRRIRSRGRQTWNNRIASLIVR